MADLGFKDHHVEALLTGRKPFTLRRAWRNNRTPDLGARLGLVSGWRTPARRRFATAVVTFRATLAFGPDRIEMVHDWRTSDPVGAALVKASLDIAMAGDPIGHLSGTKAFVMLDGFDGWPSFYAFHSAHRAEGADPIIRRELIGFGAVTAEFAE